MSAQPGSSLVMAAAPKEPNGESTPLVLFLALILLLPAIIVITNVILGIVTPVTDGVEDDMSMLNSVWRLVQGQHLGIDFHDPRGFGLFQVAAILWGALGPHYYVLHTSRGLFALIIISCACAVAKRRLRKAAGLAALFCITTAFLASGPSIYGYPHFFGFSSSYNRLMMSGLLVLFVQNLTYNSSGSSDCGYTDHLTAALLLNVLFLIKISGLVVGLAMLAMRFSLRGDFWRHLRANILILLFLAGLVTVEVFITKTNPSEALHEYRMAAQGRMGFVSALDVLWFASQWPILVVVGLTIFYAVSRQKTDDNQEILRNCLCIVGFYWVCQVVLNMSNGAPPYLITLAPALAVVIASWADKDDTTYGTMKFKILRPNKNSTRQIIPLVLISMVLVPEGLATLRALHRDYLISVGLEKPITISANRGVGYRIRAGATNSALVPYFIRAIRAIERLNVTRVKIANLDNRNPFPVLFLAPDPKRLT